MTSDDNNNNDERFLAYCNRLQEAKPQITADIQVSPEDSYDRWVHGVFRALDYGEIPDYIPLVWWWSRGIHIITAARWINWHKRRL